MKKNALVRLFVFVLSMLTVNTYEAGKRGGASPSGDPKVDDKLRKAHKAAQEEARKAQENADKAQAEADKKQKIADKAQEEANKKKEEVKKKQVHDGDMEGDGSEDSRSYKAQHDLRNMEG